MKVDFFRHNIENNDRKALNKTLESLFLSTGEVVASFEKKFANFFGDTYYARGVTSCTAALHLALVSHGIGKGDEVITTPLSYVATAHAIEYTGAQPHFVDVNPRTGNINVDKIEKAITKKTRAIIPVHLYGQMVDMQKIYSIAKRRKLVIIEDAAHALESSRDGVRPGQLSDAACFSFYTTKSITSGEGGAVLTRHPYVDDAISKIRHHGVSRSMAERYGKPYQHYDIPILGWKYNMSNIQAALLSGQLSRARKYWGRRREIAEKYQNAFKNVGIECPDTEHGVIHGYHAFTIWVSPQKRDAILHAFQKKGIGVAVNYRPIHLMTYYREKYGYERGDFPQAEAIGARTITLPLYPKLTDKQVEYVIKNAKDICLA